MSHTNSTAPAAAPKRELTLFDSTCIIVGIIVGAGIYETTPLIASCLPSPAWLLGFWLLGGLISLVGALCYAELATAFPEDGGDYVYLTQAFGRWLGFLFGWAQLWVVRPGSIGAMAFVFARYANQLVPLGHGPAALLIYSVSAVVILSAINILGVSQGKWTQNVLTTAKVLGLVAIAVIGLCWQSPAAAMAAKNGPPNYGLALIFILFAYGGWSEMAYVGAEVRNPDKNILRALVLGTVAVAGIYLLVNTAFLHMLGFQGTRDSDAVAAEVLRAPLEETGAKLISLLIAISALGACNGNIFTGARIFYAMGTDHRLYALLGRWSARFGTPVWALVAQGVITVALVIGFGQTEGGFGRMVIFTTPVFFGFLVLVGIALYVLRVRQPGLARPYRVPFYPFTPAVFCLSSLFMVYSGVDYAARNGSREILWIIVATMALGLILAFIQSVRGAPSRRPR